MTGTLLKQAATAVQELAHKYEEHGYKVIIHPTKEELPGFLQRFHPDVVATRPEGGVVAEVQSKGKVRRVDYWRELAETVRQHSGWHLELLLGSPEGQVEPASISTAEILVIVEQSNKLAQIGENQAALLLCWSAAEAALRLVMEQYDVDAPNTSPNTLISALYSNGYLDKEDYDALLVARKKRDTVAHGYRQEVTHGDVEGLQGIISRLMEEIAVN